MCRHLAYIGPPVALDELLLAPPHSLSRQSWAPQDMRAGGTINADGYGVGWYPPGATEPVRVRRTCPIWADQDLPVLARNTRSTAVLAAVRSATPGMPVVETASAPFAGGRWLFSHNGAVPGWPDSIEHVAKRLPVSDLLRLEAPTDSALLWLLVRSGLKAGGDPGQIVGDLVQEVGAAVPGARLNLLLTDGRQIVASAWYHALAVLAGDGFVAVSSEPWDDDPRWRSVPDRHLLRARVGGQGAKVDIHPLDQNADPATDDPDGAR